VLLDGPAVRPVLNTARSETSGAWLPNGREFVYTSNTNGPYDIWVRGPDSRARRLLPTGHDPLPPGFLAEIAIAPDGERFAFGSGASEHTLWVLRPSGGRPMRIDPGNPDQHSPTWSPDGNWIAYARAHPKQQLM